MKKLILILFLSPLLSLAQTGKGRAKSNPEYCMLIASPKNFSKKMNISVDHGLDMTVDTVVQKLSLAQRNELGDIRSFTSPVQALNYMAAKGWTLVSSYQVTLDKEHNYVLHYLLKRNQQD